MCLTESKLVNISSLENDVFKIPKNIINLLWIADGNFKNYSANEYLQNPINSIEPSLISLQLPIAEPTETNPAFKLDYYPSYATMTPEQRYVYLKWLQNPLQPIEIGYVFVFYYGLERHLLEGEFEEAFEMILKLRENHDNSSFQAYSFNALLLSSMLTQKYECFEKLDKTLDKTTPNFDMSIYLAVKKWFGVPLSCEEIISLANKVKFQNKRYINNNYIEFITILQKIVFEKYGESVINLSDFDKYQYDKSGTCYIANTSFNYHIRECHYPDLLNCAEFKEEIHNLLKLTHESVKNQLAEQRKNKMPVHK